MSGPVKPVFSSPTGLDTSNTGSVLDNFITRHSFREDVSKSLASVGKEEHQRRMKSLRKEVEQLEKTAWQYEPIEKLLGQS